MKTLHWVGTSLDDLRRFPATVRAEIGTDLRLVQQGVEPRDWKPMPAIGPGVREIRVRAPEGAFRVFYVIETQADVYVLHAFQKKSQKTAKREIDKARSRYRLIR